MPDVSVGTISHALPTPAQAVTHDFDVGPDQHPSSAEIASMVLTELRIAGAASMIGRVPG